MCASRDRGELAVVGIEPMPSSASASSSRLVFLICAPAQAASTCGSRSPAIIALIDVRAGGLVPASLLTRRPTA